ncbi:MAG: response regulator [Proteobacteria bacterium]|nr:response regulator [Pseudomonadota bacterium]
MGKKKILIVDDSQTIRVKISQALKLIGFDIIEAINGVDALKKLDEMPKDSLVDLVVTDINMPEMGGFQLILRLKANPAFKKIPIIVLTSETETERKQEGKAAGVNAWVVKPVETETMQAVVKKILNV